MINPQKKLKPVAIIIQARMGSTRLPGKALADIAGQPALGHVFARAQQSKKADLIILATTTKKEDRVLIKLAKKYGVKTFTGSEQDVLDRYYQTAKKFKARAIVRITGDCPLIDPQIIDLSINKLLTSNGPLDYVGFRRSYPDGLDVETFSFTALAQAWREAKLSSEREHVTPYIWQHSEIFKIDYIEECKPYAGHLRLTLDEPADLELIRKVYSYAQGKKGTNFYLKKTLQLFKKYPELNDINKTIGRNEGLLKSIKQDQRVLKTPIDKIKTKGKMASLFKKTEGEMNFPKFVAEISSNHNQDLERAKKMIAASAAIGCWAVKFQLFKIDQMFAPEILSRSPRHRERQQWELPLEFIPPLTAYCHELGLKFSCTPFYLQAVKELEPYVDFYKIASYELLWEPLLAACAETGKPIVISTGMATLSEIQKSINILVKKGCRDITVLHCTSAYPTPPEQCNLKVIATLRSKIKVPSKVHLTVGWSDHSASPTVISRAINRWQAEMVEFHIDLAGQGAEAGAGHCWLPEQMKPVIEKVHQELLIDGNGVKKPVPAELSDRIWRRDPTDGLRPFKTIRANWQKYVPDPKKYPLDPK